MPTTFNTDLNMEEFFIGSKKILSHHTKTGEITYHDLPVIHTTVHAVYESTDDRGSRGACIGYFSDPTNAMSASAGKGYFGGNGEIKELPAIVIVNRGHRSVYVLASSKPIDLDHEQANADAELRKKTIAGLTDEQIRVLGLERMTA